MLANHKRVRASCGRITCCGAAAAIRADDKVASQAGSLSELARRMKLTGIDQLWVADITYIRLKTEFVYLAGDPRRILTQGSGVVSGSDSGSRLASAALEQGVATRQPPPGVVLIPIAVCSTPRGLPSHPRPAPDDRA